MIQSLSPSSPLPSVGLLRKVPARLLALAGAITLLFSVYTASAAFMEAIQRDYETSIITWQTSKNLFASAVILGGTASLLRGFPIHTLFSFMGNMLGWHAFFFGLYLPLRAIGAKNLAVRVISPFKI